MCRIILIALFGIGANSSAQVAVIGNKGLDAASLDMTKVKNLFLLVSNEINGTKVRLFDINGTIAAKGQFFNAIGKTVGESRKIWLKARLTGNGVPPETLDSEDEVLAKVESTSGGIGYISLNKVTSKVKILLIIE